MRSPPRICSRVPRPRSSSTKRRTTSPTFRRSATSRSTAHRRQMPRPWPPATPESAWLPVLSAPASSHIDFVGSPRPTLGVEWEFALVDAQPRDLSNEAAEVIVELGENNPHVHKELLRNTVEIVTGICDSVPEAMDDLRSTLG